MARPIRKSPAEIEVMRVAGRLVAETLQRIEAAIAPGVTTADLDRVARETIREAGARAAFEGYPSVTAGVPPFPAVICASVNEEVVHGIPGDRPLREGDIVSVDVGAECGGFYGDAAMTFAVGTPGRKAARLLEVTRECLERAIAALKPGRPLRQVSAAVQEHAEENGFSVVRKFVGHGIGREMHEPPQVPNYVTRLLPDGEVILEPGMVLAIEPMVNAGGADVRVLRNGWTVATKDRSLSAHFEHTVALTEEGPRILTER